jgi:hypothetical protein
MKRGLSSSITHERSGSHRSGFNTVDHCGGFIYEAHIDSSDMKSRGYQTRLPHLRHSNSFPWINLNFYHDNTLSVVYHKSPRLNLHHSRCPILFVSETLVPARSDSTGSVREQRIYLPLPSTEVASAGLNVIAAAEATDACRQAANNQATSSGSGSVWPALRETEESRVSARNAPSSWPIAS